MELWKTEPWKSEDISIELIKQNAEKIFFNVEKMKDIDDHTILQSQKSTRRQAQRKHISSPESL